MPWTAKDAREKNSAIRTAEEAELWAEVANKTLVSQVKKGVAREKAETIAIQTANAAVKRAKKESVDLDTGVERLVEYTTSRGATLRVDRELGVIRGVKVLGFRSRNDREYLPEAVKQAIGLYDGVGVNVDHIDSAEQRSYRERIGYLANPVLREDGAYADLRINPKHALAEQLFWDAEHAPQNVGLSHDAVGKATRRNGRTVVESIDSIRSVDLVAEPATTAGLFECFTLMNPGGRSMSDDMLSLQEATFDQIKAKRPDLIELMKADLSEAEAIKAKDAEIADLKAKLKEATDREAAAKHRETVLAEVKAAGLGDHASEVFLSALLNESDETRRKALIDDRKKLIETNRSTGRPKSDFAEPGAGGSDYGGPKTWIRRAVPA